MAPGSQKSNTGFPAPTPPQLGAPAGNLSQNPAGRPGPEPRVRSGITGPRVSTDRPLEQLPQPRRSHSCGKAPAREPRALPAPELGAPSPWAGLRRTGLRLPPAPRAGRARTGAVLRLAGRRVLWSPPPAVGPRGCGPSLGPPPLPPRPCGRCPGPVRSVWGYFYFRLSSFMKTPHHSYS